MKILIVGAGRVGTSVAENLVSEHNDITVIDPDPSRLSDLQERFDLRGVVGDGSQVSAMQRAGAEDADMIIACAATDAINLVACKIARQVFNVPRRVARIRSSEIPAMPELLGEDGFCVDALISPESSVTDYLTKLVEFPEALQVVDMARGKISVITMRVSLDGFMANHPLKDLRVMNPDVNAKVVDIVRLGKTVTISPETILRPGDELLLIADAGHAHQAVRQMSRSKEQVRRVMIAGGGNIGARLARNLANEGYNVRIIEQDIDRCEELATTLPDNVLVLHGNGTDESLLERESIEDMDTWMALTSDDEDNIMSSLMAKRMGAQRVIALINRQAYGELMQGSHIDIAISPSQATMSELLRYVRRGDIVAAHRLRGGLSEVLELVAHGDKKSSKVIGKSISSLELPKGASIGAVVREQEIIVSDPHVVIEPEDHVIVFVPSRDQVRQIEKLFQVSASFF
jgi:trk system potassium uptake protein TrkA